mgnify:CR=1 FL=1
MSNDLATMQSQLQEKVRQKIQDAFMDLIPPGLFVSMVDAAVKEYMERDLKEMVRGMLQAKMKTVIEAELSGSQWQEHWSNSEQERVPGERVKQIITENIPLIINALFAQQAQIIVNQLRQFPRSF